MGRYRQDYEQDKPIEWQVLAIEKDKALVISKYAMDCKPYNEMVEEITWEKCSLRAWLNAEFLNTAFADVEKGRIDVTKVPAHENPHSHVDVGNATEDRIFLLSIEEALNFISEEERKCKPTKYIVTKGVLVYAENGCCRWWLRSPGNTRYQATCINDNGWQYYNIQVYSTNVAVRPAMWIKLDS